VNDPSASPPPLPVLAWRLARREMRVGVRGFRVLIACLALGVFAIAAVGSVSEAVVSGLRSDSRALLGGDVELRLLHRPFTADQRDYLNAASAQLSESLEMRAMARPEGQRERRTLVELKAVDGAYPLVGAVTLEPTGDLTTALARVDGVWGAVAEAAVLERLGVAPGERIVVGDATFEIRARLAREPDRVASLFTLGPRLMVHGDAVPETGLVQPGSLIRHHARVVVPDGASVGGWVAALKAVFPTAGWRIRDAARAAPGLDRFVDRMTVFLTFVGLTALLVGGIGVGNAVASHLDSRIATIATLKCLGAPARLVFTAYLMQVMALAGVGIVIGLVLGAVAPLVVLPFVEGQLPVRAEASVFVGPLALAAVFGLLTTLTFALWPLARAREVPAARLFRDTVAPATERPRGPAIVALLVAALALAALTVATSTDRTLALWFVGGAVLTLAALRGGAALVIAITARIPRPRSAVWRLAIANLHRPGTPARTVVPSLGAGLAVLVAVTQIHASLQAQIDDQMPEQAPAFFFIDIQNHQVAGFDAAVQGVGGVERLERVPSLRGRIVRIAGVPADQATVAPEAQWAVRGDRGLTYAATRPDTARLVAGSWWPADYSGPPLVSMDAEIAAGFGIGVGDTVTLNILGREVQVRIASLRLIDWGAIPFDFVFIFSPGVLEAAPHTHLAAVYADAAAERAIERVVAQRFDNVTTIRVREVLEAAASILDSIGGAAQATTAITVVAGGLVLAGAIAAGRRRRVYDAVVFKVMGATRPRLAGMFLIEYGLLGLVAGLIAAVIGSLAAWGVVTVLMDATWAFRPDRVAGILVVCVLLAQVVGFAGTGRALRQPAAPWLRNP